MQSKPDVEAVFEFVGYRKENIYDSGICSMCHDDMIHSYRSEGKEFKLATAIISL